jgi:hypothetical protein
MSKVIEHSSPSSHNDNLSMAERMYEEWARIYGLDFTQTSGSYLVCESVFRQFKLNLIRSAPRITLCPNTWATIPAVRQCFASERDALTHDWLMVGADLYTAIQKSKIALPRAGDTEIESASATPAG